MNNSLKNLKSAIVDATMPWVRESRQIAALEAKIEKIDLTFNAIWKSHKRVDRSAREYSRVFDELQNQLASGIDDYQEFERLQGLGSSVAELFQASRKLRSRLNRLIFKTRYLLLESQTEGSSKQDAVAALLKDVRSIEVQVSDTTKSLESTSLRFRKLIQLKKSQYTDALTSAQISAGFIAEAYGHLVERLLGANSTIEQRVSAAHRLSVLGNLDPSLKIPASTSNFFLRPTVSFRGKGSDITAWLVSLKNLDAAIVGDSIFEVVSVASSAKSIDASLAASGLVARSLAGLPRNVAERVQLSWISRALLQTGLEPIHLDQDSHKPLLDRVQVAVDPDAYISEAELVTVLMPARNASAWIETAVQSLTNQTWRTLQIIVIDDASEDDTLAKARRLAKHDSRIEVVSLKKQHGAYAARNAGLKIARGEFITVHDADDWSHPRKVEKQVKHLVGNRDIVANLTQSTRVDGESLNFHAYLGKEILRQNSSSLMFRRHVFDDLGYWDEVPFGADTEFHHRIRAAYGAESAPVLNLGVLSLTRYHSSSLSGGGVGSMQFGLSNARATYLRRFNEWHEANLGRLEALRLEPSAAIRAFEIPAVMKPQGLEAHELDLLIVGNLGERSPLTADLLSWLETEWKPNFKIGIRHTPEPSHPLETPAKALLDAAEVVQFFERNECPSTKLCVATLPSILNVTALDIFAFDADVRILASDVLVSQEARHFVSRVLEKTSESLIFEKSLKDCLNLGKRIRSPKAKQKP